MKNTKLRIGFMGTPDFSAQVLKDIIEAGYEVACVYTQPPRPKGRGHKVQLSPVHEMAEQNNIPVLTPESLKSRDLQQEFISYNLDVAIVAAYGMMLPQAILDSPQYGCLNIHPSLLPKWRGPAPVQYALWKGDKTAGVSVMRLVKAMDAGPIFKMAEIEIMPEDTTQILYDKLWPMGSKMLLEVLQDISTIEPHEQNHNQASYAKLFTKEDGRINWSQSAQYIDCQLRALNPWPGVWTEINQSRFKIKKACLISESHHAEHGKILNKNGDIACGLNTILRLTTIQPDGKIPMDFASALNGGYLNIDDIFH